MIYLFFYLPKLYFFLEVCRQDQMFQGTWTFCEFLNSEKPQLQWKLLRTISVSKWQFLFSIMLILKIQIQHQDTRPFQVLTTPSPLKLSLKLHLFKMLRSNTSGKSCKVGTNVFIKLAWTFYDKPKKTAQKLLSLMNYFWCLPFIYLI